MLVKGQVTASVTKAGDCFLSVLRVFVCPTWRCQRGGCVGGVCAVCTIRDGGSNGDKLGRPELAVFSEVFKVTGNSFELFRFGICKTSCEIEG